MLLRGSLGGSIIPLHLHAADVADGCLFGQLHDVVLRHSLILEALDGVVPKSELGQGSHRKAKVGAHSDAASIWRLGNMRCNGSTANADWAKQ